MTRVDRIPLAASPLRVARKVVVAVTGTTVLAVGVALTVLPGPAIVVIPFGLSILATEFPWARRLLRQVRQGGSRLFARWRPDPERGVPVTQPVAVGMLAVKDTGTGEGGSEPIDVMERRTISCRKG